MLTFAAEDWKTNLRPPLAGLENMTWATCMSRTSAHASKQKTGQLHTCQAKGCHQSATWPAQQTGYDPPAFHDDYSLCMAVGAGTYSCLSWLNKAAVTKCCAKQAVTSFEERVLCISGKAYCCSVRFEESRYTLLPANSKYTICHASVWAIGNL